MGLNARGAIDPRFVSHFTSLLKSTELASIKIIRKDLTSTLVYNQQTGLWSGNFITVWTGTARIQPLVTTRSQDKPFGAELTGRAAIRVQTTAKNTGANLDDIILVTACANNPELTKFAFDIRSTVGSSNEWGTTILCEADMNHS